MVTILDPPLLLIFPWSFESAFNNHGSHGLYVKIFRSKPFNIRFVMQDASLGCGLPNQESIIRRRFPFLGALHYSQTPLQESADDRLERTWAPAQLFLLTLSDVVEDGMTRAAGRQ